MKTHLNLRTVAIITHINLHTRVTLTTLNDFIVYYSLYNAKKDSIFRAYVYKIRRNTADNHARTSLHSIYYTDV